MKSLSSSLYQKENMQTILGMIKENQSAALIKDDNYKQRERHHPSSYHVSTASKQFQLQSDDNDYYNYYEDESSLTSSSTPQQWQKKQHSLGFDDNNNQYNQCYPQQCQQLPYDNNYEQQFVSQSPFSSNSSPSPLFNSSQLNLTSSFNEFNHHLQEQQQDNQQLVKCQKLLKQLQQCLLYNTQDEARELQYPPPPPQQQQFHQVRDNQKLKQNLIGNGQLSSQQQHPIPLQQKQMYQPQQQMYQPQQQMYLPKQQFQQQQQQQQQQDQYFYQQKQEQQQSLQNIRLQLGWQNNRRQHDLKNQKMMIQNIQQEVYKLQKQNQQYLHLQQQPQLHHNVFLQQQQQQLQQQQSSSLQLGKQQRPQQVQKQQKRSIPLQNEIQQLNRHLTCIQKKQQLQQSARTNFNQHQNPITNLTINYQEDSSSYGQDDGFFQDCDGNVNNKVKTGWWPPQEALMEVNLSTLLATCRDQRNSFYFIGNIANQLCYTLQGKHNFFRIIKHTNNQYIIGSKHSIRVNKVIKMVQEQLGKQIEENGFDLRLYIEKPKVNNNNQKKISKKNDSILLQQNSICNKNQFYQQKQQQPTPQSTQQYHQGLSANMSIESSLSSKSNNQSPDKEQQLEQKQGESQNELSNQYELATQEKDKQQVLQQQQQPIQQNHQQQKDRNANNYSTKLQNDSNSQILDELKKQVQELSKSFQMFKQQQKGDGNIIVTSNQCPLEVKLQQLEGSLDLVQKKLDYHLQQQAKQLQNHRQEMLEDNKNFVQQQLEGKVLIQELNITNYLQEFKQQMIQNNQQNLEEQQLIYSEQQQKQLLVLEQHMQKYEERILKEMLKAFNQINQRQILSDQIKLFMMKYLQMNCLQSIGNINTLCDDIKQAYLQDNINHNNSSSSSSSNIDDFEAIFYSILEENQYIISKIISQNQKASDTRRYFGLGSDGSSGINSGNRNTVSLSPPPNKSRKPQLGQSGYNKEVQNNFINNKNNNNNVLQDSQTNVNILVTSSQQNEKKYK